MATKAEIGLASIKLDGKAFSIKPPLASVASVAKLIDALGVVAQSNDKRNACVEKQLRSSVAEILRNLVLNTPNGTLTPDAFLGCGSSAIVLGATYTTEDRGERVAVKISHPFSVSTAKAEASQSGTIPYALRQERQSLKLFGKAQIPGVPRLIEDGTLHSADRQLALGVLVLKLMPGRPFGEILKDCCDNNLSESRALVAQGMAHSVQIFARCLDAGVYLADFGAHNILVGKNEVTGIVEASVVDFGDAQSASKCGETARERWEFAVNELVTVDAFDLATAIAIKQLDNPRSAAFFRELKETVKKAASERRGSSPSAASSATESCERLSAPLVKALLALGS